MATSRKKTKDTKPETARKSAAVKSPKPAARGKKTDGKEPRGRAAKAAPAPETAKATAPDAGNDAKARSSAKEKALSTIQAIAAKASASGKSPKSRQIKKSAIAVFTLDDVRDVLKTRTTSGGEGEAAEVSETSTRKAVVNNVIPEEKGPARVLGAATLADILGFGPRPVTKAEPEPLQREVPAKFRKYYDQLQALRKSIQGNGGKRAGIMSSGEDGEAALPAQTEEDDNFDHNFALSLVANKNEALVEIDAAIERIFDGTYGICEITGKVISAERLDAVPFARFSVEGQAQFEMQNRRRAQRTTTFLDSSEDAGSFAGEDGDE